MSIFIFPVSGNMKIDCVKSVSFLPICLGFSFKCTFIIISLFFQDNLIQSIASYEYIDWWRSCLLSLFDVCTPRQ